MLTTERVGQTLREAGFDLFTGVPCSFLTPLINYAQHEADYVNAANEGDAVAVAAGAVLGGRHALVMFQNSGLTNALSPLTSLVLPYRIPMLGLVTWRGEPGRPDAPQHALMGAITPRILDLLGLPYNVLAQGENEAAGQLAEAARRVAAGESYFLIIRAGTFSPVPLRTAPRAPRMTQQITTRPRKPTEPMARTEVLETLVRELPDALVVATTGYTGRALAAVADRPEHFYMTGSMGCASSIGLGLALARPNRIVVVVDGDGAALMRLGSWPALAQRAPPNLLHLLLDNGCHESTGGQATLSSGVDFVSLARASGYPFAGSVSRVDDLAARLRAWRGPDAGGLTMLVIPTRPGIEKVMGRPEIPLQDLARRFSRAAQA